MKVEGGRFWVDDGARVYENDNEFRVAAGFQKKRGRNFDDDDEFRLID